MGSNYNLFPTKTHSGQGNDFNNLESITEKSWASIKAVKSESFYLMIFLKYNSFFQAPKNCILLLYKLNLNLCKHRMFHHFLDLLKR